MPPVLPARGGRRRLYLLTALLSLVGLGDSIYLTVKHLTGQSVRCTISTGCDAVLASAYASVGGFPLAAFGALAYFAVFSLATLALFGYRGARMLLLIIVGLMTLMTLRLLYLQAFVLQAYCEFCLLSALITLSLAGLMLFSFLPQRHRDSEER
ncbi:MAG: vitamin K epoxide reductase family protein [Pyrinomonadaceae bacterium]|nr:vitamin K epoxide reductase family protein [Pyrinomonadaceae bacterium]